MENPLTLSILCVGIILLNAVNSFPVDISSESVGGSNPLWLTNYFLTGFGFFLIILTVIFGCVCCRNIKGFEEFRNNNANLNIPRPEGFVNPTLNSELTIFPPLGANANEICRFEPLPDIKYQTPGSLRPAAFCYTEQEISSQDWFFDPYCNFPRNQLKYVQEYGRGWFGRVVEGEAQNITPEEKLTKVMVKILHEDATPTDHMYFLHEVKFYRDLKHPNILQLLGRCLETEPFLVILECYPNGDLKTFLSQNLPSAQALVEQGVTLQMCSNITSGLQYMHDNKFIHTDLAARNCLVGPDLSVKIGDYGNSIEIFKSDYYCAGSVALPIRWCAPETLKCTDITIETREVTPPANIWSLGVVFWEICEFCKLPYAELNDDEVIVRVLGEKNYFLEKPNMICLHKDEMYHLMKLCWKAPVQRPTASQIYIVLNNLISGSKMHHKELDADSKRFAQDFEQRWQNLKPNSIPKKDNAIKADLSPSVDCSNISSKIKNSKVADSSYLDSPLGIFMSSKSSGVDSPRLCLNFDKKAVHKAEKDPLQEIFRTGKEVENLKKKGNIDSGCGDVFLEQSVEKVEFEYSADSRVNPFGKIRGNEQEVDSWLKGVEINNEEDESFVRKISEAIRDLDATLAMEKTSSSEENSGESSRQNSPGKDVKEVNEPVVDFKLGNDTSSFINFTQKSFKITSLQNTEQPQSLNFTDPFNNKKNENYGPSSLIMPFMEDSMNKCKSEVLEESLRENDSLTYGQSRNSSDTDDEIWRKRIEKGEISEKVKEKSKSIANLMILTHIDSDDSDIDFDKPFDKGLNRSSFIRRSGSFPKSSLSSNNFGSENDLTFAVLEDDFKESLKKLTSDHKEHGHFDSLGVILPSSANRENVWENLFKPSDPFVGNDSVTNENNSCQTDVNKTVRDSEPGTGAILKTNNSEEKSQQNPQNRNNFLGNVASEKLQNTEEEKLIKRECQSDASTSLESSEQLIENSEKGNKLRTHDILEKENQECDSRKFNINRRDSLWYSSQFKESDVDMSNSVNNSSENSFLENVANESSSSEGIIGATKLPECAEIPLNDGRFLNEERSNSETETKLCDLFPKICSVSSAFDELNEKEFSNLHRISNTNEENELKKVSIKSDKMLEPEIFVDDNSLLPRITITEETEDKQIEHENNKFEIEKPGVVQFVSKDFQVLPVSEVEQIKAEQTIDFGFYSSSVNDKFFEKNSEKDFTQPFEEKASVIVGACEDYTMDYFKGLKTTSEDLNLKNQSVSQVIEENLDVWDKHLEKAFTQLDNADSDICFRSFDLDSSDNQDVKQISLAENCNSYHPSCLSLKSIVDFIESEKLHTEKLEEPIHINRLTSLAVMANEEDYEHFKLRTPDDERSSDSGFRDKGSLSESVEDACEGKYNLEDIEAELEEAFVKGVFGNNETDKEKDSTNNLKNCNNFEYEESKFYEDGSKNEEDFSDIDGEIEFWHNKDESDYYPEISEFHPTFSQGWYLHPPDDSMLTLNRNVNEDIVNALRNELQESLPVQSRSFVEFNDFYETEIEGAKRDLNIHYGSDFALPLSPILEEQNSPSVAVQKNFNNFLLDGNKSRKHIIKLMESVKAVDTNTFKEYLDFMIENEGRDFDEKEETEEKVYGSSEHVPQLLNEEQGNSEIYSNSKLISTRPCENSASDDEENTDPLFPGFLDQNKKTGTPSLNAIPSETASREKSEPSVCGIQVHEDDCLEVITDNSENDGLVFTPQMLSPDRERSLSEISRSSNGTRTGDALSEITMSSPDLVPDCFSASVQEIPSMNNDGEVLKESYPSEGANKLISFDNAESTQNFMTERPEICNDLTKTHTRNHSVLANEKNHFSADFKKSSNPENKTVDSSKIQNLTEIPSEAENPPESNDLYEMSTSFMGCDDEDEISSSNLGKSGPNHVSKEHTPEQKTQKGLATEDSDTTDWQSDSSEDEELSSSSGEFIWKDGNKESKIKAAYASDIVTENSLYEKTQGEEKAAEKVESEPNSEKESFSERETLDGGDEDDDNESSTGSSASITDFVPSAWNSQAIPSRSALRSPNKKADEQKKNVWFKKQKYHCVYEYPREPSDSEDSEGSPYKQMNFDTHHSEPTVKHFNYGVNTVELPNQHFPYGISKVIDFSTFADWDVVEGDDADLSSTDTDSENGAGKTDVNVSKNSDLNFYNLSPFDYDFNTTDLHEGEREFFVSSSSRPFQGGSSSQFSQGTTQSGFNKTSSMENKNIKSAAFNSKDFITPDSGIEDSTNVTPSDKVNLAQENELFKVKNFVYPKVGILDIFDDLSYTSESDVKENVGGEIDLESFGDDAKSKNGFSDFVGASIPLSSIGLGELRHAKGRLKLDLPRNHNSELGAIINKKNQ